MQCRSILILIFGALCSRHCVCLGFLKYWFSALMHELFETKEFWA